MERAKLLLYSQSPSSVLKKIQLSPLSGLRDSEMCFPDKVKLLSNV